MALTKFLGSDGPVHRLLRYGYRWTHPSWESVPSPLNEADWRSQHDEISKTIWNLTTVLVGSSLFCLFVLGAPDASLVSTDAKITIPVVSISASYADFLLFAPIFLIGVTLYLHVFIEKRLRMGRSSAAQIVPESPPLSPYIFNLGIASADLLSMFLFYGMLPCTLAFFVWKAIPRPAAAWPLMFTFVVVSGFMIALKIRRFEAERQPPLTHFAQASRNVLWALLALCAVAFFPLVWLTGQTFAERFQVSKEWAGKASDPSSVSDSPLLRLRRLQLFGASLEKRNLSDFYGPYADLRKANLQETDMEGANLSHADLRKADLTDVNLTGSSLRYAHLEGANLTNVKFDYADLRDVTIDDDTKIDIKWRRVICIVNGHLSRDCLRRNDLTWVDLTRANLEQSDLHGQQMTGADLSFANLSKTDLTGAILRVADLRYAELPPSIQYAVVDGALTTSQTGLAASGKNTVVVLMNRANEACFEEPLAQDNFKNPSMAYPCARAGDRLGSWSVKRMPDGSIVFGGMLPGRPVCLDGTTVNDNAQVQMWDCNDDYTDQHWRLIPVTDGFVRIAKNDTGFCIDGADTPREFSPIPVLRKCDVSNHSQHWLVTFPPLPAADQAAFFTDRQRRQRERDLTRVSEQFSVSPAGYGYGFRYPNDQSRHAYQSGPHYGRWFPTRYYPFSHRPEPLR